MTESVPAAGPALAAAPVGAAGLAFTVGLAQTLSFETDVLLVGAQATLAPAAVKTTELTGAVRLTDVRALALVAIRFGGVLADPAEDAAPVVTTLLGRARASGAGAVEANLARVTEAAVTSAPVAATGLVVTLGLADAETLVIADIIDAAADAARAPAPVVAALLALAPRWTVQLADPLVTIRLIGGTEAAALATGSLAALLPLAGAGLADPIDAACVAETVAAIRPTAVRAAGFVFAIGDADDVHTVRDRPRLMNVYLLRALTCHIAGETAHAHGHDHEKEKGSRQE
jgi:hypothetical protein